MTRDLSVMARAGLMFGVSMSALMVSGTALAQDATQTPPATPAPEGTVQADQTVTEDATGEATDSTTIVVTGSRIRQPEFTSPDPVSLIDPTLARREGKLDIAQTLQSSPIAAGSTQITAAISSNFVTNGGPGAQARPVRAAACRPSTSTCSRNRSSAASTS